jgi:hypothetical protein
VIVFQDFDAVERSLRASRGVLSVQMGQLRDACGVKKLGVHVRAAIEDELEGRNIGYFPRPLPASQGDPVRLYEKGTVVSELIEAATAVGDVKADEALRNLQSRGAQPRGGSGFGSIISGPLGDVIRTLHKAESRNPFVALKWFRDVVLPGENFEWTKDETARDASLRDAINRHLVLTSKEHNPRFPDRPTTSIRLNRSEPEVEAALRVESRRPLAFEPISAIRRGPLSATVLRDRR